MARPRSQSIRVRQYHARRAGETKFFQSREEANAWAKRGTVSPHRLVVEDYILNAERICGPRNDPSDPATWSKIRLFETMFTITGTASESESWEEVEARLRREASARREASYDRLVTSFTNDVLGQQNPKDFPATARRYALERVNAHFHRLDIGIERFEVKEIAAKETARISALPTIGDLFKLAVEADLTAGRISAGTADGAEHVAGAWLKEFKSKRVDLVSSEDFRDWLTKELAKPTGGSKRLKNAVGELHRLYRYLVKSKEYGQYAPAFNVAGLRVELEGIVREADGSKAKCVLTGDEVENLIKACNTDWERGAVALALLGIRSLGEVAAAAWEDVHSDLGSQWLQVNHTVVDLKGGKLHLDVPKDVKIRSRSGRSVHRHCPITARLMGLIEPLRGNGKYILGDGDELVDPGDVAEGIMAVIERAGLKREGITSYSIRHTVMDLTDHLAGTQYRDLLHRGDDDKSTANKVYTHRDATRFRQRLLMPDGKRTCADVMPWAVEGK